MNRYEKMKLCKLYLAPMAGAADSAMRRVCEKYGADGTVTEMVSATAVRYNDKKTYELARIDENERSCSVQVFGHDPDTVAYAVRALYGAAEVKPCAFDINMGCPVRKVVSNGDGSALMRDLPLAGRIIEAAVGASPVPVTVKMRTGWDKDHKNCVEAARVAEQSGASAVCVHGRTREDMYLPGTVDIESIAAVKAAVGIPVVANGDITGGESAARMLEITGADALMIGRAALGDPFVFERIKAELSGTVYTAPSVHDRVAAALYHFDLLIRLKGERTGVCEGRRHMSWYVKGAYGSANVRKRLNSAESAAEMINILKEFDEDYCYDGTAT